MRQDRKPSEDLKQVEITLSKPKPFTRREVAEAFAPDPEWEKFEAYMARRPWPSPED